MILDRLALAGRYASMHPGFAKAFEFLAATDLAELALGKLPIDGDRLYAIAMIDPGRGRHGAKLEAHRKYIDIQCVVSGCEGMGWKSLADCRRPESTFEPSRDIGFFLDSPDSWFTMHPGEFAIFFPEDAHAPLAGEGDVRKVVVKVALEW
jgi:YhcH/YjgK/YiaL family protein